ncbi:baseplate J/gp47 family protein [Snodgrassella sp. B3088]|uniref:baseplate J/gp47 family protein n=1 Tax=unclassified Snodgrassella TaxID=2625236 RepID=UPI00226A3D4A|nr:MULTISPECIES: baseplate J/gp47 family protein [unclassified Snodgrassella]MCX8748066.1 baseplate J/gp47 family protein [Snodgrassella sp. B3088]MCX8752892.1 baseplate J/gp47 family protein [Snodgrassella sp. B3837]
MHNIPTFEEIRQAILRDMVSLNPETDVSSDSDNYIRASSLASCATGQYAHQAWILKQFFPDTADTDFLERHCNLRGIRRKNATSASGTVIAHGIPQASIDADLQIKCGERLYTVLEKAYIKEDGTVVLSIRSLEPGVISNQHNKTAQFMAAPVGVSSDLVNLDVTGGTDVESDNSLLNRLLDLLRRPPAGGNQYDYKAWALSVDGVTSAYVYPLRRGLGTVDVVITSGDNVPSDDIVSKVQNYIDSVRPVTAKNSMVVKPDVTKVDIEVKVSLSGGTFDKAANDIKQALQEHFSALKPGDSVIASQLEAVISDVTSVTDRKMTLPKGNLVAETNKKIEWFMLGEVDVGLL